MREDISWFFGGITVVIGIIIAITVLGLIGVINKNKIHIAYSFAGWLGVILVLVFTFTLLIHAHEAEKKGKIYREYTNELYAFTETEKDSVCKDGGYYLIIENNNNIIYITKTEEGIYQRKTLIVDEKKDNAKIYFDFQDDENVLPKMIIKTIGYSEEYLNYTGASDTKEVIISYTFIIPANSIKYNNMSDW